jgi:hypothetical protein
LGVGVCAPFVSGTFPGDASAQAADAAALVAQLDQQLKDAAKATAKLEKAAAAEQQLEKKAGADKAGGNAEVTRLPSWAFFNLRRMFYIFFYIFGLQEILSRNILL